MTSRILSFSLSLGIPFLPLIHLVCVTTLDPPVLAFHLSQHRPLELCIPLRSHFIRYNKQPTEILKCHCSILWSTHRGQHMTFPQFEYNWRATAPDKWDVISSGNWTQKAVWNRMVTVLDRDQPHKTPVTSTWTSDFLTRDGEGRKAMGDWLRSVTVTYGTRRFHGKLAEVSSKRTKTPSRAKVVFKNGVSTRMGSAVYASAAGRWTSSCWVVDPLTAPLDISRVVCADSKPQRPQVPTMLASS